MIYVAIHRRYLRKSSTITFFFDLRFFRCRFRFFRFNSFIHSFYAFFDLRFFPRFFRFLRFLRFF